MKKLTDHQKWKKLYLGKSDLILLACLTSVQRELTRDFRNQSLVDHSRFILSELLKRSIESKGTKRIDALKAQLLQLDKTSIDTSMINQYCEQLEKLRTRRLTGRPNPIPLNTGAGGNGTGKSAR